MSTNTDAVAQQLCDIACDLLDMDLESDDNFFESGGHSLLAVKLVGEARKAGIEIVESVVFECQTFTAIAERLAANSAPQGPAATSFDDLWRGAVSPWQEPLPETVVPLTEGSGTPFFCVHWGTGNIAFLGRFARRAGFSRPLYGVRSGMTTRHERPLLTVGERARRHYDDIRRVQPHGPYLIGGLCSGGLVAMEIARLLRDAGEEVADLVLVNCEPPTAPHGFDMGWGLADYHRFRIAWLGRKFGYDDIDAAAPKLMPELTALDWYDQDADLADWNWLHLVWASLTFAQVHYEARPYAGNTSTLYHEGLTDDSRYSWRPFLTGTVDERLYPQSDTWEIVQQERFWADLEATLSAGESGPR